MTNYSRKAMVYPKHVLIFTEMNRANTLQLRIAYLGGVRKEGFTKLLELSTKQRGFISHIQRRAVENNMSNELIEKLSNFNIKNIGERDICLRILRAYENGMDEENLKRLFELKGKKLSIYSSAYEEGMNQNQLDQLYSLRSNFAMMNTYYLLYRHGVDQEILDNIEIKVNIKNMKSYIQKYKKDIDLEKLFSKLTKDDYYDMKKELLEDAVSIGWNENVLTMMADLDDYYKMYSFKLSCNEYMSERNLKLMMEFSRDNIDMERCRLALLLNQFNNKEFELFVKINDKSILFNSDGSLCIGDKTYMDNKSIKKVLSLKDEDAIIDFCKQYVEKLESKELEKLVINTLI